MLTNRALLPALGLALALCGTAAAQPATPAPPTPAPPTPAPPTPAQALALEQQITEWLNAATAGALTIPPRPVQLTPEGDHLLVRVPLAPLTGTVDPADAAFTATARPLDGTRWALDDQRVPASLTLTTTQTVPDGPDTKTPGPDGTHAEPVTYRVRVGQQDGHGVFDTSFATPTTSTGTLGPIDIEKEGGLGASLSHIAQATTSITSKPTVPDHADLLSDLAGDGYTIKSQLADGSEFALEAAHIHVATALSSLQNGQLVPLLRLLGQLATVFRPPGGDAPDGPTPDQVAQLHAMLANAHGLLTGARLDESVEDAKFGIAGGNGALRRGQVAFAGEAPADLLSASMDLLLDGLVIDSVPPPLAAYVPTHLAIHPTLSNVSMAKLTRMGLDATAPVVAGQAAPKPDLDSLFADGGIAFGFEGLSLDMAGAQLTGTGTFTSVGPRSVTGKAALTAHGLDALIARVQADPVLQQLGVVPVLIFIKGIAHTTGDAATWDVAVDDTRVLVNGVDLSAMARSGR